MTTNSVVSGKGLTASHKWRTGRKLKRTIYVMLRDEPSDKDILLGMMDSGSVAAMIVKEHNTNLK